MTSVNVEQSQLSRWVLGLLLVSMVVLPSRLWAAPETMELFSSGGSTTAQGPTLANQTNTYRMNPDNPTANTQVQVFPNLSVTYELQNQQFTGTGTDVGMTFGTSTTGIREIYIPLSGQGSPANTDFSSSRLNAANPQGIDVNANYGTRIEVRAGRLNGQSRNTTGVNGGLGYYFGDVVLTWSRPVLNPVINVSGLGGTTNGHGISAQLQLFSPPSGTTISRLSGRNLGVSGFNITNTAATLGPTASNGGAAGSIQVLNTNPISSLRFRVYLRTDTTSTLTTWQPTAGDAIVFSGSSTDAIVGDLFVSKTNNVSSLTSGSSTTYTVTVTNNGPSTIDGAVLTDSAGSGLSITGVSCSSLSGNRCTTAPTAASLTGSGVTLPSLASGQSYQLLVTGNVTALSSVSNSATVSLPTSNVAANTGASCVTSGGITRTFNSTTGACTSTDTDTVSVGSVASPPAQCVAMLPQTVGNASQISGQVVQLTPDAGSQIGAAWSAYRADLTQPFDFSAYVNVGSKDVNGADGLTFVFHNDSRGFTAIGQSGRSIGAGIGTTGTGGITPSFIIEFDTYNNGDNGWADPVGDTNDHAAVYLNGDSTHAANSNRITVPLNIGNIEDGQWREMRVVWNPTTQTLTYYLGGALIYSGTVNLQGILGTSQAYWGYTASTGGFTNQHQVCNINLPPSPVRLQVNKTSNGPWTVGQSGATYNLAVRTQTGTTVASSSTQATIVRDVLPTGIAPNWTGTLSTNGWSCTFSGQNVTCTQSLSLAANGAATSNIVLPVQVVGAAAAASPVTNYASVGGGGDSAFGGTAPTPGASCTDTNRCSSVQTAVTQTPVVADLSVTKTDGVSSVNAGGSTSYTVVVTNNGPSAANGATFQDAAASGLSKTTVSCVASGGAVCPVGVTVGQIESGVAITTLPSGGSVSFTIGANVTATSGSVANTATITAPAGTTDNVVGNNSATDTDTVIPSVSISGRVFTDNSGTTGLASNAYNATQEAGEVGLANSTIRLTNCAGSTIDITKTNAVGDYAFAVLQSQLSSPFCIEQDNLAGYTSVSGTTGYARATDTITVSNTGALSYSNHNFGDARLGLILTSDGQQTTTPGGTVSYPHILRAESVLTPTLTTSTTQQPNNAADQLWTTVLYRDSNCNGVIDPSETPVGSLGTLLPNQDICVVQRVNAPTNASNGAQHVASLSASYVATVQGGAVLSGNSDTRKDTTLVGTGGLDMSKQVRVVSSCPSGDNSNTGFATQNSAKNGQFLEYQILYKNRSTRNLSEVVIRDVSPTNTLFKSAQCQVTPAGSSCAVEAMPVVDSTGDLRWRTTGPVAPNAEGSVRFCVQVPPLQ